MEGTQARELRPDTRRRLPGSTEHGWDGTRALPVMPPRPGRHSARRVTPGTRAGWEGPTPPAQAEASPHPW